MENNRVFLYLQVIFGSVLFALGLGLSRKVCK